MHEIKETEYINKDKLLKQAMTIPGYSEKILEVFDVEHAPAEDVVQVVRCRECKWYDPRHMPDTCENMEAYGSLLRKAKELSSGDERKFHVEEGEH